MLRLRTTPEKLEPRWNCPPNFWTTDGGLVWSAIVLSLRKRRRGDGGWARPRLGGSAPSGLSEREVESGVDLEAEAERALLGGAPGSSRRLEPGRPTSSGLLVRVYGRRTEEARAGDRGRISQGRDLKNTREVWIFFHCSGRSSTLVSSSNHVFPATCFLCCASSSVKSRGSPTVDLQLFY